MCGLLARDDVHDDVFTTMFLLAMISEARRIGESAHRPIGEDWRRRRRKEEKGGGAAWPSLWSD